MIRDLSDDMEAIERVDWNAIVDIESNGMQGEVNTHTYNWRHKYQIMNSRHVANHIPQCNQPILGYQIDESITTWVT